MTTNNLHLIPTSGALPFARTAGLATLTATATNVIVFGVARSQDVTFAFPAPGSPSDTMTVDTMTVDTAAVVLATFTTMLVGWAAAAFAVRHHRPSLTTMAIIGAVVALVSCTAPITLDATSPAKLTLASLHLVAGLCYVAGIAALRRTTETER